MSKKRIDSVVIAFCLMAALPVLSNAQPTLEEVVVTAQKREQSLQEVPISISALSGDDLAANLVTDVFDLRQAVPALEVRAVDPPSQGASFALRGLGTSVFNMGFEPTVATFIDGVYRSRTGLATVFDLVDLERVEVLKGPQGTLFGKNSTAGVVHFITRKPELGEFDALAQGVYEERDRFRFNGMVNLPVNESVAARLSGSIGTGDGWIDNISTGKDEQDVDRWTLKAQLLWEPDENLSVRLSGDYSELEEACCQPLDLISDPQVPVFNLPLAQANGATEIHPADLEALESASNIASVWDAKDRGFSAEINWRAGNLTLTSITAYRDYEDINDKDNDFGGVDILRARQNLPEISLFSEEFRLSGVVEETPLAQSIDWTLGLYYATEDIERSNEFIWASQITSFPQFPLPPGFFGSQPGRAFLARFTHEDETFAIFAHGTLRFTDKLALTGGFRWTRDEKKASLENDHPANDVGFFGLNAPPFNFNAFPLQVVHDYSAKTKDEEPTGTASLQYNWTDDVMTFITYSHGFKAGGISLTRDAAGPLFALGSPAPPFCPPGGTPIGPVCNFASAGDPTFRPEFADHYELGLKSTLLDDRLRLNIALWRTDFENLQVQTLQPAGNFAVENIAGARSQGVEVEGNLLVVEGLRLNASAQWLDATFDKGIGPLTPGPGFIPLGGENLPFSSEWTGTVGALYERPLANTGWTVFLGGNVFFRSEQYNFTEPRYDRKLSGYELVNLHGGFRSADGRWEVKGWCRNCGDKRYTWSQFQIPFDGAVLFSSSVWGHPAPPRFAGVTLTYRR